MRPRRRRIAWWGKWLGTLGCALLAAAFVFSRWSFTRLSYIQVTSDPPGSIGTPVAYDGVEYAASLNNGGVTIRQPSSIMFVVPGAAAPGWNFKVWGSNGVDPWFNWSVHQPVDRDYHGRMHLTSDWFIPLWIPFIVVLIPTLISWYCDRCVRAGRCRRCRYDLTRNTSGRCPECGTAMSNGELR